MSMRLILRRMSTTLSNHDHYLYPIDSLGRLDRSRHCSLACKLDGSLDLLVSELVCSASLLVSLLVSESVCSAGLLVFWAGLFGRPVGFWVGFWVGLCGQPVGFWAGLFGRPVGFWVGFLSRFCAAGLLVFELVFWVGLFGRPVFFLVGLFGWDVGTSGLPVALSGSFVLPLVSRKVWRWLHMVFPCGELGTPWNTVRIT